MQHREAAFSQIVLAPILLGGLMSNLYNSILISVLLPPAGIAGAKNWGCIDEVASANCSVNARSSK
uniref:Uncharacterized protein n=1 Tax=Oryza meridionalis TaxID=40149 RepID=A0A0E0DI82_9ORYZ